MKHIPYIPFGWVDDMKIPFAIVVLLILLFFVFACSGCGVLVIYDTKNGNVAAIKYDFLESVNVASYRQTERGVTIEKGSSVVDDAAVQAITAGVVEGLTKGLKP